MSHPSTTSPHVIRQSQDLKAEKLLRDLTFLYPRLGLFSLGHVAEVLNLPVGYIPLAIL